MLRSIIVPALVLALLVPGTAPAALPGSVPLTPKELTPLRLDVTDWVDESITVPAGHALRVGPPLDIGPGRQLNIAMGGSNYLCTSNFVWEDAAGKLYLGTAGHCVLPADKTATHGPGADFDASGVKVRVCVERCTFGGFSGQVLRGSFVDLGPVAYARQSTGGTGIGHDFGLIEIPASLYDQVDPGMPLWGGPTTSQPGRVIIGTPVCHYGYGVVWGETLATHGRVGSGLSTTTQGYSQIIHLAAGGDSGSGAVTCQAGAGGMHGVAPAGIITHATGAPGVGAVGGLVTLTTIERAQQIALQAGLSVSVVPV